MIVLLAAGLLSLAVAGGFVLGILHARRAAVPVVAGLAHAALALAGVALLAAAVWQAARGMAINTALLLFVFAVIGGVFILLFRLQREAPPGFMIVLHGGTAAVALVLLWVGIAVSG